MTVSVATHVDGVGRGVPGCEGVVLFAEELKKKSSKKAMQTSSRV